MSTQSNGLQSKKKAELIDIILRKDDVERNLRSELDAVKLDFEKAKTMREKDEKTIKLLKDQNDKLEIECNNFHDVIDDATLDAANNKFYIKKYKTLSIVFAITTVIATALIFIL